MKDQEHPLTQAEIEAGLSRLGLEKGQIFADHRSLSSFSPVDGGLAAVVGEEGLW
jgi:aminoglycoside N3'-acetyltransferase